MTALAALSTKAQARLKKPRTRGAFKTVDAARRQLGLLSVADAKGQGRLYWLVDPATSVIEDARFLAFGDLASHPVLDAFTELSRGNTVADACRLAPEQIDSLLRDDPVTPAVPEETYAAVRDLQARAEAALPELEVPPLPAEVVRYVRKRKADWTAEDEAWLPLNLFKKAAAVEEILGAVLHEKLADRPVSWRLDGINDDFLVRIRFTGLPAEEVPTLCRFLEDALRAQVHSQLSVEEVA